MELPLLERREIEATVIAPIVEAMGERFGRDAVLEVLEATIERLAKEHGAALAKSLGGNELADLARVLDVWRGSGALEIEMVREDDTHFEFDVKRCHFAEMYRRLGIADLGPILSCNRDFCFAEGFNPDLELERPKTLMKGDDHCNFRFRKKSPGD
ncbi:MAG: L-2-amino-thiazoline-4-carboxylic acid hydrolase [Planctomycetota bacterium]|jgi:predicted hydrocarbon binding protein